MNCLPSPPTDAERDSYFTRHVGLMVTWGLVGMTGIVLATVRMATSHPTLHFYIFIALLAAMFFAISFTVNVFTHDADLLEHRTLIERWRGDPPPPSISVDVWLPVAGEDLAILENSWKYVRQLEWDGPLRVLVGDDADNPVVREAAERHGFDYFVRSDRPWMKKAGNMRNLYLNSSNEFVLILDADFAPRPDFLYELMPYFDDNVGIVQSPQHFRVLDDQNWLERGAGAVQELFYRAIQTSREQHDGAVCVGTNAIYRRAALDDNGGTTLYEHSEDIRTGFDVRLHGWKLTYIPANLATGLCPDQLHSFMRQQYRWCLGSVTLLCSRKFWGTSMKLRTRCCYLAGFGYYLSTALNVILFPLLPVILLTGYPGMIHLHNYLILAPAMFYAYVGFPFWHRCKWGVEAWSVQMLYSWSHVFALFDMVRRRPMGWTPTGAAEHIDLRGLMFRGVLLVWSGGMALTWVCLALYRWTQRGDSTAFLPLIFIGMFYLLVVTQTFMPIERKAA